MVDGSALLTSFIYGLRARGAWRDERGVNLLDGGAPFYDTYATADGGYVAVGALEPQFYAALLAGLGLAGADLPAQLDPAGWPVLRERFATIFAQRSRDEWAAVFDGTDACVAPVLTPAEVARHPHNAARGVFIEVDGVLQPAPAPRFGRSQAGQPMSPVRPGTDTDEVLGEGGLGLGGRGLGLSAAQIAELRSSGVVA
jgi:alpha-methylacyl-CoA racemase